MTIQPGRKRTPAARSRHGQTTVYYPESDGKPMAETGIHVLELIRLIQTLSDAFADRDDAYVIGNMFLYYEEGNPRAVVAPDVMVVFGVPKEPQRRTFKTWEERAVPAVIFEVTSRSTRSEDLENKRALYARLGVREYFLYDPLAEYLHPAMRGFRLRGQEYEEIQAEGVGALLSDELEMRLVLVGGRLRLFDRRTGAALLSGPERAEVERTRAESEAARAEAEAARADEETQARRAAERRIAELEALLRQRGSSS